MIYSYVQPCPSQTFLTDVLGEEIPILHQTNSFHFIPTRVTDQFFRPAFFSQASSLEEGKGRMVFKLITPLHHSDMGGSEVQPSGVGNPSLKLEDGGDEEQMLLQQRWTAGR